MGASKKAAIEKRFSLKSQVQKLPSPKRFVKKKIG
jgi:hypothetical protein